MMVVNFEQYRMVPMILVMGIIFFLSHQPGDALDLPSIPGIDKVAHFSIYGLLAVTVILAHKSATRKKNILGVCLTSLIVCLLYGMSDEYHQSFVPGRFVSNADILADVVGAAMACAGWLCFTRKWISRRFT